MHGRSIIAGAALGAVLALGLPFVGGGAPTNGSAAYADKGDDLPVAASAASAAGAADAREGDTAAALAAVSLAASADADTEADADADARSSERKLTVDVEHLAQKPVPKPQPVVETPAGKRSGTAARQAALAAAGRACPAAIGGSPAGAPGVTSAGGVGGTTSSDLASFAQTFNAIRVANCLEPVPMANIRYDACLEARLFWIAEDPSPDVNSAWGHNGTPRSDGVPAVGCDGNLAGGSGNTGATVAQKWWNSSGHQRSLYRPSFGGSVSGVVICFAMVHGGLPADGSGFARSAARWGGC